MAVVRISNGFKKNKTKNKKTRTKKEDTEKNKPSYIELSFLLIPYQELLLFVLIAESASEPGGDLADVAEDFLVVVNILFHGARVASKD